MILAILAINNSAHKLLKQIKPYFVWINIQKQMKQKSLYRNMYDALQNI